MSEHETPGPHPSGPGHPESEPRDAATDHAPPAEPPPYLKVSGEQREIWRSKGEQAVMFGSLWVLGGLLITLVTYMNAAQSPYGGIYIVTWGPVLYGLYRVFSGIVLLRRSKR